MPDDESPIVKIAKIETSLEAVQFSLQALTRQWEMLNSGTQETQKLFGRLEQLLLAQEVKNSQFQGEFNRHEQECQRTEATLREQINKLQIDAATEKATIYGVISGVRRTYAVISICIGIIMSLLTFIFNEKFVVVQELQRQVIALQIATKMVVADKGKER